MTRPEPNPYVGLRNYEVDDARNFFGRQRESLELTSLVLASRLVVLYGPSGVGKTSLLHAGVLAGLDEQSAQALPVGRPAAAANLPRMSSEANPFTFRLLSSWAPHLPESTLKQLTLAQFLEAVPVAVDRYGDELPLVAVIDQFEGIFSDAPLWATHREQFLAQLGEAVNRVDRLHLLISLREDMVGEILPYESRLSRNNRTRFHLRPLDREAAHDAVVGPLIDTARGFAEGVAAALVDRLMSTTITNAVGDKWTFPTEAVEPINLQVICSALWRGLPGEITTITLEHLQDYGDVESTLTAFTTDAVDDVAEQHQVPAGRLWEWLEIAFVTDHGTRNVAYQGIDTTAGMPNPVARAFEERRILRSERRSGSVWFELLHDGLIEPVRAGRRRAVESGAAIDPTEKAASYLQMAESALDYGMSPLAEEFAAHALLASADAPGTLAEVMSLLGKLVGLQGRAEVGERADELYATAEDHYRKAAELFEAEQKVRAVAQVLASLGGLFRERGRYADALSVMQSAVSRMRGSVTQMPGDIDLHIDLARAFNDAGQPLVALGQYDSLLTVVPDAVEALVGRGVIGATLGEPTDALADLDRAIRLQPSVATRPEVVDRKSVV